MFQRTVLSLFQTTSLTYMTVCIGVKNIVDYNLRVRVKENELLIKNVKMTVNPFDEIAIEQAIKMKEKNLVKEIYAITVGNKKSEDALRTALALGCTKAIHIVTPDSCSNNKVNKVDSLMVAKVFAKLNEEIHPDLWILGKQAVDDDCGVTAQLLAGLLDIPQGIFVSKLEVINQDNSKNTKKYVKITREIDTGVQVEELQLPCVISVDLHLNVPRLPKLPMIMKARKHTVDSREFGALMGGVDLKEVPKKGLEEVVVEEPAARKRGIMVKDVEELYKRLKNEAKVI